MSPHARCGVCAVLWAFFAVTVPARSDPARHRTGSVWPPAEPPPGLCGIRGGLRLLQRRPAAREKIRTVTNPSVAVQDYETTLELTYGCAVRPGLLLQPDLQYIIHPGGNKAIPNALAIGVNIDANF